MYTDYKNKIISFYKKNKRMPGYSEIMSLVGFKSKNAVFKLISKMVDDGVIEKDKNGRIIPKRINGALPVLGLVEAGVPSVAEVDLLDQTSLDELLVEDFGNTYLLEVKGDSMIEEGIKEGDMVVAERRDYARDGEIVIAEVDGGWTMKYYKTKNGKIWLEPANKNYKAIHPQESFHIAAVVKGVVRKY
jgi:SOS regulatory protein LexA